jgi:hypothetical protein
MVLTAVPIKSNMYVCMYVCMYEEWATIRPLHRDRH